MIAAVADLPEGATSELVWITPDEALDWLENTNTHNRTVSQIFVDELAKAIRRGEWRVNGDAVRFDRDGILLDGQHRLWAIVQSECPIQSFVVRGLEPEVQQTMDTGRRRSLVDTLHIQGKKVPSSISAAVSVLWRWESGIVMGSRKPTITQGLAVLEANPGLAVAVTRANQWRKHVPISASVLACVFHRASDLNADDASTFFERLASGAELQTDDPIYVLRRYAQRQQNSRARSPQYVYHAMTIKAWNAWREGRRVQALSFRPGGATPEAFPEMV